MNTNDCQNKVIDYSESYGFSGQDTGGNCTALQLHVTDEIYFMITDDAEIPEYIWHHATFGIYIGDRQIFDCILEVKFGLYIGQKIHNVLTSNLFSKKLNFDIAEVASWLLKNNTGRSDAWDELTKAYQEHILSNLALSLNTSEELNVTQVALDHYVEFLEDVYIDETTVFEYPKAEQKQRIDVAKSLVKRLKEVAK